MKNGKKTAGPWTPPPGGGGGKGALTPPPKINFLGALQQATGGKVVSKQHFHLVRVGELPHTSAASAPWRPSPAGAGNASHKVFPRVRRVLTTAEVVVGVVWKIVLSKSTKKYLVPLHVVGKTCGLSQRAGRTA